MNNDDLSLNDKMNYLNYLDNDNYNEIKKSDIDGDANESKIYYEYGAHFRYKDLFKKLLKLKKERKEKEANKKKIINNNIIINNNFNLFNNKSRGVSRNIQINEYLNSYNNYDDISKTFICYITYNQYKSVFLPSIENIQKNISNYLIILEMDKIKNLNKQNDKIIKINPKNLNKTAKFSKNKKNKNLTDKFKIKINSNNKEKKSAVNNNKIFKKIKSSDKNAINLKKNQYIMNTLPFKYNINKNINSYIFKRIKEIFNHRKNRNWTKKIIKQVTKSKSGSKSRTKSKTNIKNKNRRTIFRNGNKIYNNLNQFTKYTDKNTSINIRYKNNNNFCSKKKIKQYYTTKIINNKKRKNNILNCSNSEKQRKAHSSSAGKSQKYDLNSLIHNDNLYIMMNERKIKSPSNKIKKNYKPNFLNRQVCNIITFNNYLNNHYKINTKNQLLKNSMNLNSLGVSIVKTRDSKDNIKSENNISKSNSKTKNSNINIRNNNNIINIKSSQVNKIKSINDYTLKQSNKKVLKKLKAVSPLKITLIFKSLNNKLHESSKIYSNQKRHIYIKNKVTKNKLINNKSLDSQKMHFKRKKIKDNSNNSRNMKNKSKNKILSRNFGGTIQNNNMGSNNTNIKINSKDIFNNKLHILTLSNINKMKQKLSRNITSNLSSFLGRNKKNNLINNTNSYVNANINYLYKNKGALSSNNNNSIYSNLIKKETFKKGSKSKKNIYLFNNPNRKNIKKKLLNF